jgi:hypothetical protein
MNVNFIKHTLGNQGAGKVVEVTLTGVESDVFLVDPINLSAMEHGSDFQYHGGHYKQSPVRLTIPSPGQWFAIVVPGPGGTVRSSARVLG